MCSVLMVHCNGKELLCSWSFPTRPAFTNIAFSSAFLGCGALKYEGCTEKGQLWQNYWQNAMLSPGLALVSLAD